MNKKGLVVSLIILLILLIAGGFIYAILVGKVSVQEETICTNKPSTLSCNQIKECYDKCNEPLGLFKMFDNQKNCRDKLRPYLTECLRE